MREIVPGILHWTAKHPNHGHEVSSYFVPASGVLIDPLEPEGGADAIGDYGIPVVIALTCRHHRRHAPELAERFGIPIVVHEAGLHEFADGGPDVQPYRPGDEIAPGVTALEMGAICPDDAVLLITTGPGALAFGDSIVNHGGVGFVPDSLIGDDPEAVKHTTRERARALLDQEFDALLFAHGDPIPSGGHEALARFANEDRE
jgi:glyoxylase-like metal-dependent hydrolase (beta-lactamase superfamily II)